jgi:uncharacterized cupin superfamily protein
MARPSNVIRIEELSWVNDESRPPPFGGRTRELYDVLPLDGLGMNVTELEPGAVSGPLHDHLFEEECFYVLDGVLTVLERSADGRRRSYELRAGELVVYRPGTRLAHRSENRSDAPVRYFAVSDARHAGEVATYPDSGKTLLRAAGGIGVLAPRGADPRARVAAARERAATEPVTALGKGDRPAHVATLDAETRELGSGAARFFGTPLSGPAGATAVFVHRDRLPSGCHPSELHRHSADEEAVLVLSGALELRQVGERGEMERCTLEPFDLAHFGPGGVAHQLVNRGDVDAVYLVVGTARPWDVIDLPERGERYVRVLGERGALSPLPYWEGEGES